MSWYATLDRRQRSAFWACLGGWALDAMDVQMYALILPTLLVEWHLSKGQGGTLGTAALLASSLGGAIAGNLADRIGRVRILQVSILWFSLFTALSGFAQTYPELFAARIMQGLGFGGEWAAGAVLMAETIDARARGRVLATISSGWSIGYGIAALLYAGLFMVLPPALAWRALLLLGILPAGLVIFVRRNIAEPEMYLAAREAEETPARLTEIFGLPLLGRTLLAWALCLGVLGGNYTVLTWLPTYLQSERHLSSTGTGLYLLVNIVGSFIGYLVGGVISDRLGRRRALALCALLGSVSVYSYLLLGSSPLAVLALGFPLGFAQSAMNAGIAPLLSELYPTRLRATGQGFCYNAGRGFGAAFPLVVGVLAAGMGLTTAISLTASIAYAVVLLCSLILPETRNRHLESLA
jgi:MFS family permease